MKRSLSLLAVMFQLVLCMEALGQGGAFSDPVTDQDLANHSGGQINTANAVGAIVGSSGVSAMGAANYAIPLYVAPGTNGMQPHIGIAYDSNGGNGVLGYGWGLSGLSAIVRTGQDYYHEHLCDPIRSIDDDRFALDGERLVILGEDITHNGDPETRYDTEDAKFNTVTAHGTSGSGPTWFSHVIRATGLYREFGSGTSAQHSTVKITNNDASIYAWLLNKEQDAFGNYMTYTYQNDGGQSYLDRIDYTANDAAGIHDYNAVVFSYVNRPDVNEVFVRNFGGPQTSKLLASVTMYAEGTAFKRYEFNYCTRDHGKSYLREVIEYGDDLNQHYNSTLIKYGEGPSSEWADIDTETEIEHYADCTGGDFDGDGRSELLVAPYSTGDGLHTNTSLHVYRYDGAGTLGEVWNTTSLPSGAVLNTGQGSTSAWAANQMMDMNGDGRTDIVIFLMLHSGGNLYVTDVWCYRSVCAGGDWQFVQEDLGIGGYIVHSNDLTTMMPQFRFVGDFNGDGFGDIIMPNRNAQLENWTYKLYSPYRTDLDGQPTPIEQTLNVPSSWALCNSVGSMVMDFDGDGATEIMCLNPDGALYYELNELYQLNSQNMPGFPTSDHNLYPGDFNGDGKVDLLSEYDGNQDWETSYFTGISFYGGDITYLDQFPDLDPPKLTIGDFDGDGLSDVAVFYNPGMHDYHVFYSQGMHTAPLDVDISTYPHDIANYVYTQNPNNPSHFYIGPLIDFDGDGKADLVNVDDDHVRILSFHPGTHERRVEQVMDGMGNGVKFEWAYATDPDVHTQGVEDWTWPNCDVNLPLPVVVSRTTPDGIGGSLAEYHHYDKAKINRTGKGFLGFTNQFMADGASNKLVVAINDLITNNGMSLLAPSNGITLCWSTMEPLEYSSVINLFEPRGIYAHRYLHTVLGSASTDVLTGVTTSSVNDEFDDYGTVLHSTTDVGGVESTEVTSEYGSFGPSPLPNRETSRTSSHTRAGQTTTVTQKWNYYSTTGALQRAETFVGQPKGSWDTFEYDVCGNLNYIWHGHNLCSYADLKQEKFTHDSYKRFVGRHEFWSNSPNVNGWVAERLLTDPKWGVVTKHEGYDGLTTETQYDRFGRVEKVSAPYAAPNTRYDVTIDRSWTIDQHPHELWMQVETNPSGPTSLSHFDLLGREIGSGSVGEFGTSTSERGYDENGLLAWETTPHHDAETYVSISHYYDAYRRPKYDSNSLSGETDYEYDLGNGLSTTTVFDPSGKPRRRTLDAAGRMIAASDNGGELTYSYDSRGLLLQVAQGNLVLEKLEYDDYGGQTLLVDADAGTTHYTYDGFGRLVWQKDANENETTLSYDNQDRLLQRTEPEGTTTYSYFYANGRYTDAPVTVSDPHVTMSYVYNDPLNRLTSETQNTTGYSFGSTLTTSYQNDPVYDRRTRVTYPNGIQVRYYYFNDGSLDRVTHGGTTLYRTEHVNGLGQCDQYTKGDGYSSSIEYSNGFPLRLNTPEVQDLRNVFDYQTGNLLSRCNVLVSRHEAFEYDFLDRLTKATVSQADGNGGAGDEIAHYDYEYDGQQGHTLGNLNKRTDVGNFGYAQAHAPRTAYGLAPYSPPDPPLVINYLETQELTYTSYSKTATITEAIGGDAYHLEYGYDAGHSRCHSRLDKNGTPVVERWYNGSFERQYDPASQTTTDICYVEGGDGLTAMIITESNVTRHYYPYKDHLGSILYLTCNDDHGLNGIQAAQNFNAWGRKRNPDTWMYEDVPAVPTWLYRGFTGHEHVEPFALINMNGRMYDPLNGRMLGTDNFVNGSSASQAFNRYSYGSNNPLSYVDPDGQFIHLVIGAAIGGIMNWAMHGAQFDEKGLEYFAVGATCGALTAGVGAGVGASLADGSFIGGFAGLAPTTATGFTAGSIIGASTGFVGGFSQGIGNSFIDGKSEKEIQNAFRQGIDGMALGAFSGGILGGIDAAMQNRAFFSGQESRRVVQEFNTDGTITVQLAQRDKVKGPSDAPQCRTSIPNSKWFNQTQNPNGTWTAQARLASDFTPQGLGVAPGRVRIWTNTNAQPPTNIALSGRILSFTTPGPVQCLSILGSRPFGLPITGLGSLLGWREIANARLFGIAPLLTNWRTQ